MTVLSLVLVCAFLMGTAYAQSDQAYATPATNEVLAQPAPAAGYLLPEGTRVKVVSRREVVFHLPKGQVLTRYDNRPVTGSYTRLRLVGQCSAGKADGGVIYRLNGKYTVMSAGCPGGCETLVTPLD